MLSIPEQGQTDRPKRHRLELVHQTLEDLLQAISNVLNGETQFLINLGHMHEQRALLVLL